MSIHDCYFSIIYGIHIEGNSSKLFVNPRGFIVKEEDTLVAKPL